MSPSELSYNYGETPIEVIQERVRALPEAHGAVLSGGKLTMQLSPHDAVTILEALKTGSFDAAGLRVQMLSALGIEEA